MTGCPGYLDDGRRDKDSETILLLLPAVPGFQFPNPLTPAAGVAHQAGFAESVQCRSPSRSARRYGFET
jgi:hypothetical protein